MIQFQVIYVLKEIGKLEGVTIKVQIRHQPTTLFPAQDKAPKSMYQKISTMWRLHKSSPAVDFYRVGNYKKLMLTKV